jgi:hypothetical protein
VEEYKWRADSAKLCKRLVTRINVAFRGAAQHSHCVHTIISREKTERKEKERGKERRSKDILTSLQTFLK